MPFWRRDAREIAPPEDHATLTKAQLKSETRARQIWSWVSAFLYLITVIFLIIVEVAMTDEGRLENTYFLKLDLTQIVPTSIPNYQLLSTIAQTLGLHDFYQVGLWNYCAGYVDRGITVCSEPQTLFWFNPIAVIQGELLAGASIPFPGEVQDVLHILKTASQWMFALFLTGACTSFVSIFLCPLAVKSKLLSIPLVIFTFLASLTTIVATVLATAIFVIFRNAARAQTQLNLGADIGVKMFVFMWIAAGAALVAWVLQLFMMCCCRSRRKARREWEKENAGGRRGSLTSSAEKDESPARAV